jgi:hypothetical protein
MRMLAPVCAGLFAVSAITSAMLWRELQKDHQLIDDLRTQLTEAKTALAAKPAAAPSPAATALQPSAAASATGDAPAAPPAKITAKEAAAVFVADAAKRQEALLKDSEYRKARVEQARINLKRRYNGLAEELGITEKQADAVIDLLAESQIRMEEESARRLASGATPDAATIAEMGRIQQAEQQKQKEALVAMLGAGKYEQFQDFEHIQPSRTRVNNLSTLLAREGQPMTSAQSRSLTAAIVAEQKRMEQEAQALRDAGQDAQTTFQEREAEANRRILQAAGTFLSAQQLEKVRGRFEQRAAIGRANDRVQQAQREAAQ